MADDEGENSPELLRQLEDGAEDLQMRLRSARKALKQGVAGKEVVARLFDVPLMDLEEDEDGGR
jgi:hypothetical protein